MLVIEMLTPIQVSPYKCTDEKLARHNLAAYLLMLYYMTSKAIKA